MGWVIAFFSLVGINFTIWIIIGFIRFIIEQFQKKKKKKIKGPYTVHDVAAIIPAHNEELTIHKTIDALLKVLPAKNIYVASDNSSDNTVKIAREKGVRSLDIRPNRGKARSIVWIMSEYRLLDAYKLIIINDADVEINGHYLERALPLFADKDIACVAPHGVTKWGKYNFWETFFIAYRIRLWRFVQIGMRYGMTWKMTNVSFIVPGSLCLYRSDVLKKIEIDAPDLVIEDFNMTFELQKKKLGKIAYSPKIFGIHQDPYTLNDYTKQVTRWNVGYWQTIKRHGIWPSLFFLTTMAYTLELYFYSIFIAMLPVMLILLALNAWQPIPVFFSTVTLVDLFLGLFVVDYLLTVLTAIAEKKPILLLYGFGFLFLRYVDSMIFMASPIIAFTQKSSGLWVSPARKALQ